ncbi:MAG TPA: MFS transporter, partial [Acidimicrobiales bacterium]|nr:MFS transporter [Acidimicrobiales bacterium]
MNARWYDRLRPSKVVGDVGTAPLLALAGLNMVDELDREAAAVLLPEIRDHFGLSIQGILTLVSIVSVCVLFLQIPLSHLADRRSRTKIAAGGAAAWGVFSFLTALAPNVWSFGAVRGGAALGQAVNGSTHRSLLADHYPVINRAGVYGVYDAASPAGRFLAALAAGVLADLFGWRVPFMVFAVPTMLFVWLTLHLQDPVRGFHERSMLTGDADAAFTEERPASLPESMRMLWQVRTLRRIWIAIPVLSIPLYALSPLLALYYEEELGLSASERGLVAAAGEPFAFIGLFVGIPIASKLLRRDPAMLVRFLGVAGALQVLSLFLLVMTNNLVIVVGMRLVLGLATSCTAPALAAGLSLVIPPRVRSVGFTIGNLFIVPTFLVGPIIGGLAEEWGLQRAIMLLCPMILIGVWIISTAGSFIATDISKVQSAALAMAEARAARERGESKLLIVRNLDVHYDDVQVLFGIDLEVDEGEIIALLGTNGAGKTTLLRAISGIADPSAGAIVFDGDDMTYTPADEVVRRGIVHVPGGRGVFPTLTVAEHVRLAGWTTGNDDLDTLFGHFPVLRDRWEQPAGNLSGGEQQMLTLGMAFLAKPRLLMIDELSLGLAPIVVEQLLGIVRAIAARGTTIILVEQSVTVALTVAETAYFLEKGEVRFHGPTAELLERPDVLRAVFLGDAPKIDHEPRAAGDTVLATREVSVAFGGVHAVRNVSIEVPAGQILGIIGPNGAGKTTLFDLLSGYLSPDSGRIVLDDRDVTELGPDARARAGMGRSFQDARLFPGLTIAETIALALERH